MRVQTSDTPNGGVQKNAVYKAKTLKIVLGLAKQERRLFGSASHFSGLAKILNPGLLAANNSSCGFALVSHHVSWVLKLVGYVQWLYKQMKVKTGFSRRTYENGREFMRRIG